MVNNRPGLRWLQGVSAYRSFLRFGTCEAFWWMPHPSVPGHQPGACKGQEGDWPRAAYAACLSNTPAFETETSTIPEMHPDRSRIQAVAEFEPSGSINFHAGWSHTGTGASTWPWPEMPSNQSGNVPLLSGNDPSQSSQTSQRFESTPPLRRTPSNPRFARPSRIVLLFLLRPSSRFTAWPSRS